MGRESDYYRLFMPDSSDSMADIEKNITENLEKIEIAASPINESELPDFESDYEPGDKVYFSDSGYESIFYLVAKDSFWGAIWRPIQAVLSPWYPMGPAIIDEDYQASSSYPPEFALDNKGYIHWRGVIERVSGNLPNDISINILAPMPKGIRHHTRGMFTLAIDPAPQTGSGLSAYRGGRWYIQNDFDTNNTFRFHSAEESTEFWLDGVEYSIGEGFYFSG